MTTYTRKNKGTCSQSTPFRLLQNLLNVPKEEREAMFFGGLFSYDLVAGFEAVSYTHLDVYKRQIYWSHMALSFR